MAEIGSDICDPLRIEKVYKKFGKKFLKRIFNQDELTELEANIKTGKNLFLKIAGRYAAKEALAKAFGTGIGKEISFLDLSVIRCPESGAPIVKLSEKVQALKEKRKISEIKISISHERQMAIAVALLI